MPCASDYATNVLQYQARAVYIISALYSLAPLSSSCVQGLAFHSPLYNTLYYSCVCVQVCSYVMNSKVSESGTARGEQSEPPCLYMFNVLDINEVFKGPDV